LVEDENASINQFRILDTDSGEDITEKYNFS